MNSNVMIVTPAYCTPENQRFPLLLQAIYWVKRQTHDQRVHVIVDDGSTDREMQVLDEIASKDSSLLVFHKTNTGSSDAINYGVQNALRHIDAQFITITHSDDLLPPTSLEVRVRAAQKHNASFVFSNVVEFDEIKQRQWLLSAGTYSNATDLYNSLLTRNIPCPSMLWETGFFVETIKGYDPALTSAEDYDIALRSAQECLASGKNFVSLDQVTAAYRQHKHNLWRENVRNGTRWNCYKAIFAKHLRGQRYFFALARNSLHILRGALPESVRMPMRVIRDLFLNGPSPVIPYRSEFIEEMRKIDYEKEFVKALEK